MISDRCNNATFELKALKNCSFCLRGNVTIVSRVLSKVGLRKQLQYGLNSKYCHGASIIVVSRVLPSVALSSYIMVQIPNDLLIRGIDMKKDYLKERD